jgi:N-ethylmaleimide reductase
VTNAEPLLQPFNLAGLNLTNRVVMAPMTRARANNSDLAPTELHASYYAQRASAGLIVTEGTWVSPGALSYPDVPGIYTETQISGWRGVTEAVHAAGGCIVLQIGHSGATSHPDQRRGELPAGPSAINPRETVPSAAGRTPSLTPRALGVGEIEKIIADYQVAANNGRRAGFDGVEIHAHGPQLVGQFLNPRLNHHEDDFGGTVENRARFLLEVVKAVTTAYGSPRVGVKVSPYWSNGTTFQPTEETLAGFDYVIGQLGGSEISYVQLMGGGSTDPDNPGDRFAPFARYRRIFSGALVANGGFTQATGNQIIEAGTADAVSFGAAYIANPDLVERFAAGHALAALNPQNVYGNGGEGYTDYPMADLEHAP